MKQAFKMCLRLPMVVIVCFFLLSCSKISQGNYEKIQENMSMDQVVALLGEPTTAEKIDVIGVSGTSAVWKTAKIEIDIQFINDKVVVKAFNKVRQKSPAP